MAIQQIWLKQDFDQVTLKTICGQQDSFTQTLVGSVPKLECFFLKKKSCGSKLWRKQNCYFLLRIGKFCRKTLFWVNRNRLIPHNLLEKTVKL